MPENLLKR